MASSSPPMCSRSSGVRCSRRVVLIASDPASEVDLDAARRGVDAGADHLAVGLLEVAGAKVADGAGAQSPDAGVADAHPAAVRQQRPRPLADYQERRRRVGVGVLAAGEEADAAARAADAGGDGDWPEALEVQALRDASALEAIGQGVQQARRAAGPRLAIAPVGHSPVEVADVPAAIAIVVMPV